MAVPERSEAPTEARTKAPPPHVVLFVCDQMQYQRQGRLDPQAHTPHLDRFAQENVFFTHYHAANGQCVPSRVAMQTGAPSAGVSRCLAPALGSVPSSTDETEGEQA